MAQLLGSVETEVLPRLFRGEWTNEEDLFIVTKVEESGKKWSEYASELRRTEHCVKNRYNSILIRQRKFTPGVRREEKLVVEAKKRLGRGGHQIEEERREEMVEEKEEVVEVAVES